MNSIRKTAIIVGVLFIIATTFFMIGQSIYGPTINSPDYLEIAYPSRMKVMVGMLIELIGDFAIILIPVFLFPVLKKRHEALALGYAGFRFLEAGFLIIAMIGSLSLVNISQNYIDGSGLNSLSFEILGSGIKSINEWAFMMSVSFLFPIGAMIVYYLLYTSRLVPRLISGWGFFAAALLLTGSVLIIFDIFTGFPELQLELILTLPIALQEMVFAVWLIVKGFNPSAIASLSAKTDINKV